MSTTRTVTWRVTWSHYDRTPQLVETDRYVIAPAPNTAAEFSRDAIPATLLEWSRWIGRANYGTDLTEISYAIEDLTDLTAVKFDNGTPYNVRGYATSTIHTDHVAPIHTERTS